jgi:hypothetical protein
VSRTPIACLIVWLVPLVAAAQSGGGRAMPLSQGPMTVERMHSGFLIAPDIKITEVDRKSSALAGAYAGWVSDDTFFVGAGGYWLASQSRDREMAYGGLVVQWFAHSNDRVGFSAKGLVGGGQARLSSSVISIRDFPFDRVQVEQVFPGPGGISNVRFREGFFVAEPEVDVRVRLASHLRLTGGIGYRFIAAEGRDSNRLRGAAGSVALQIGGGS